MKQKPKSGGGFMRWYVWISIAIVAVGVWGFYQWRANKNKELIEENANRILLSSCLKDAQTNYTNNWKNLCKALGQADDCLLSPTQSDSLYKSRQDDKDECFKLYSQ